MNEEQNKKWPAHQHAFEQLLPLLDYGATIDWTTICQHMDCTLEQLKTFPHLAEWLKLLDLIKEANYLVTEKGMHQRGIRLLRREEMADHVRQEENRKANDSLRKSLILSGVPREDLDPKEARKLDHWEAKTAIVGAHVKYLLRRRNLPDPSKTRISINEISGGKQPIAKKDGKETEK